PVLVHLRLLLGLLLVGPALIGVDDEPEDRDPAHQDLRGDGECVPGLQALAIGLDQLLRTAEPVHLLLARGGRERIRVVGMARLANLIRHGSAHCRSRLAERMPCWRWWLSSREPWTPSAVGGGGSPVPGCSSLACPRSR